MYKDRYLFFVSLRIGLIYGDVPINGSESVVRSVDYGFRLIGTQ